jgi:hypothetical protein
MTALPIVQPLALQCTKCGAEAVAACACGAPYVPAAQRIADYDAANPGQSNRAAAKALKVSEKTVRKARARADRSAPDKIVGLDGKRYAPKRKTSLVEYIARADRIGWTLDRLGGGKYALSRPDNNPDLCPGADYFYSIPVTLRDVGSLLDDIKASADPANYTVPKAEPKPNAVQQVTSDEERRAQMAALDQPAAEPIAAEPIDAAVPRLDINDSAMALAHFKTLCCEFLPRLIHDDRIEALRFVGKFLEGGAK